MAKNVTREEFEEALAAAGIPPSQQPRVETDNPFKYECFDGRDGEEVGFITWCRSVPTYSLHDDE